MAPVLVPLAVVSILIPGSFTFIGPLPLSAYFGAREYLQWEFPVASFAAENGARMRVRIRHLYGSRLLIDPADHTLRLDLVHDDGVAHLHGPVASRAARVLLTRSNRGGAPASTVESAVRQIEGTGDSHQYLMRKTRISDRRFATALLAHRRIIGAFGLDDIERLAVEMAVHEETERQALEGELALLEQAWREAEEIAAISDGLFLPTVVEDVLRYYREKKGDSDT
jgi:hypothetical protein